MLQKKRSMTCTCMTAVSRIGQKEDKTNAHITPIKDATYRTKVPWTVYSGAPKTMLAGKHLGWILGKNPDMKLRRSNMRFRPYSTDEAIPLLGMCDVKLRSKRGKTVKTRIYVAEGEAESLLGRQDAINLGILMINPDGDEPDKTDRLRCITPEILEEMTTVG